MFEDAAVSAAFSFVAPAAEGRRFLSWLPRLIIPRL
jgi:hypothetical protein